MEFHQLRYFVAAADHGGVSEAARRVHVSQPALSRQIKLLEEELGAPLFERVRQRIHLTGAGEVFLPRARRILLDAEEAKARVRAEFGKARPVVRLGFITPFLDDLVAPAVRAFQSTHEGIDVEFHDLPPRLLLERLAAEDLDLVLLGNFEKSDGEPFHVETLWSHRMEAVLPEGHGLARRRTLRLIELKDEKWISLADSHFPGRNAFFRSLCRRAGFVPRQVKDAESIPLLLAEVATGRGVALLPGHSSKLPHGGCRFVRISAPVLTSRLVLLRPRRTAERGVDGLAAHLKSQALNLPR